MEIILGKHPASPPQIITAEVIRGLRFNGDPPCGEQLAIAVAWIKNQKISLKRAFKVAERIGLDTNWAKHAMSIVGYGYGDRYGHGYGIGCGYGNVYGDVYGHGYGKGGEYGDGNVYGYGDGYGDGGDWQHEHASYGSRHVTGS